MTPRRVPARPLEVKPKPTEDQIEKFADLLLAGMSVCELEEYAVLYMKEVFTKDPDQFHELLKSEGLTIEGLNKGEKDGNK